MVRRLALEIDYNPQTYHSMVYNTPSLTPHND